MGGSKTLLISVVLTAFALLLVYTYVDQKEAQLSYDLGTPVDVLVASRNIPEYIILEDTMVESRSIPKKFVQPNYLADPADIANTVAAIPIAKGETITTNKLLFMGGKTGLSPVVSKGKRAIPIQATPLTSVIKPGDRIDIIAVQTEVVENQTVMRVKTALQDVFVLSVGGNVYTQIPRFEERRRGEFGPCVQKTLPDATERGTVTVEVSPREAQTIVAISGATLYYTLRNPNDRTTEIIIPTTAREVFGIRK